LYTRPLSTSQGSSRWSDGYRRPFSTLSKDLQGRIRFTWGYFWQQRLTLHNSATFTDGQCRHQHRILQENTIIQLDQKPTQIKYQKMFCFIQLPQLIHTREYEYSIYRRIFKRKNRLIHIWCSLAGRKIQNIVIITHVMKSYHSYNLPKNREINCFLHIHIIWISSRSKSVAGVVDI
jgi:hypothetical protein